MPGPKPQPNKCGAKKSDGSGRCTQPAGWGTDHRGVGRCKSHGGNSPAHKVSAAREELVAEGAKIEGLASPLALSPAHAMKAVLHLASGRLAYATMKVAELKDDELFVRGFNQKLQTYVQVPHHWVQMHSECLADLAKYSKMAMDAGVQERMAGVIESQTELVGTMLQSVVEQLDLTEQQRRQLGPAIRQQFQLLAGGEPVAA